MPGTCRVCPVREVFRVLNRDVARMTIFENRDDYDAFLRVFNEAWAEIPLPILFCWPCPITGTLSCVPRATIRSVNSFADSR